MTSTDTRGLLKKYRTANSPPVEGWQAQPDGVVASCLHRLISLAISRGGFIYPPLRFMEYFFDSPIMSVPTIHSRLLKKHRIANSPPVEGR